MTANDLTSDNTGENLGARSLFFYGNETAVLQDDITTGTAVAVSVPNSGISTTQRFELGSYIQIDSEVMRVVAKTLSGSGNNELTVLRGALGTVRANHTAGTLIKKVVPRGIELEDHLLLVHLDIHLNILVMVLVTTQQVYHKFS